MPDRNDLELGKFEEFSDYASRVILTEHARVHEGKGFIAGALINGLANSASVELLLQLTGSMHTIFNSSVSGDCEIHYFEGTTFSDAGTPLTKFNKNRFSPIVSGAIVTQAPTLILDGTEFPPSLIPGGSGGNAQGGQGGGYEREMILNPANNYLVRITNTSGGAIDVSAAIDWYEPSAVAP